MFLSIMLGCGLFALAFYNEKSGHARHSRRGLFSTAEQALGNANLAVKTAIVTGGYSGIGLETTRVLLAAGANVVVPARTPDKAAAALADLPGVSIEHPDLSLFVMDAGVCLVERGMAELLYLSLSDLVQHAHAPASRKQTGSAPRWMHA